MTIVPIMLYRGIILAGVSCVGGGAGFGLMGLIQVNPTLGWVGIASAIVGMTLVGVAVPKLLKELNK